MSVARPIIETTLETLQRETFDYFMREANPANGLILDKTAANWPASAPSHSNRGYNLFSLTRASAVVNCQSALA